MTYSRSATRFDVLPGQQRVFAGLVSYVFSSFRPSDNQDSYRAPKYTLGVGNHIERRVEDAADALQTDVTLFSRL